MKTADELRRQAATLLDEAARLDSLPQDDYPDLSIIMWTRPCRVGRNTRTYHYVALKVSDSWYITGKQLASDRSAPTWDTLVREHLAHATHLWYVTAMEEMELP